MHFSWNEPALTIMLFPMKNTKTAGLDTTHKIWYRENIMTDIMEIPYISSNI